ncbi:MAG: tyrosine-protein phosphatase [Treponema sp.]|jgi:protein-tyrosine phosphatase|nr:tyrosine-protein phosphatase [Treponema sp.]
MMNDTTAVNKTQSHLLPLEGLLNVRDLGGYAVTGRDGVQKRIRTGNIYRGTELSRLSVNDRAVLEERRIRTIVDFRSEEEKYAAPNDILATVRQVLELPIDAGNLMGTLYSASGGWVYSSEPDGAMEEMIRLYTALPVEAIGPYRELFALLSEPANTPLLFHCSAGKDRTGLASALILYALGASMDTILADYLASTEYLRKRWLPYLTDKPYMIPYMTVSETYLQTAFARIGDYGGLDRYLAEELGAGVEHLRDLYTS